MGEKIIIIGAGIAGLFTSLALARDNKPEADAQNRDITVLDRDPPPPPGSADDAFEVWERKGVGHLRHSHAFLARLYQIIAKNYPDLLAELLDAGCRELAFADTLPPSLTDTYQAEASDGDMTILTSRRTTLEHVIRRYAARQPGVRFITGTRVHKLHKEQAGGETIKITGVQLDIDGKREDMPADIIIDAGGKNSLMIPQLIDEGLPISEEEESAGILYYTRHYRLNDGVGEPERGAVPGAGDLGYIKYGLFPADNRCFSITLAVPEVEHEFRRKIVQPEIFDKICANLPGIARWTSAETSTAYSRVFGMGQLISRWRHIVQDATPLTLNFFPLGDTLIRTNPLYGRGCSFAAVQAEILRDVLNSAQNPGQKAIAYDAQVTEQIKPFYRDMVTQDQNAIRRARNQLTPDHKPGLKSRVIKSFIEDGITVALRADINLMRAAMRGFHMLDHPSAWLKKTSNMAKVLIYWARGKTRNARYYPPTLGPGRAKMMQTLGLSPQADIERLKST